MPGLHPGVAIRRRSRPVEAAVDAARHWGRGGAARLYSSRQSSCGQEVSRRIRQGFEMLKDQPGLGRPGRVAGKRELMISMISGPPTSSPTACAVRWWNCSTSTTAPGVGPTIFDVSGGSALLDPPYRAADGVGCRVDKRSGASMTVGVLVGPLCLTHPTGPSMASDVG
jgi:hypothetical protein